MTSVPSELGRLRLFRLYQFIFEEKGGKEREREEKKGKEREREEREEKKRLINYLN